MASESMPVHLPMTLQQFLEYTAWEGAAPQDRMSVALEYFQTVLPLGYLSQPVGDPRAPDGRPLGPNPWLLPMPAKAETRPSGPNPELVPNKPGDRPPINLCVLMQAIDFSYPVFVRLIPRESLLKAFRTTHDFMLRFGRFFSLLHTSPGSLAIPRDQTSARLYEATCSFSALASTVADTYVDWAMERGVSPQYRHGGGRQFYVWKPELSLRPLAECLEGPFRRVARGLQPTDKMLFA